MVTHTKKLIQLAYFCFLVYFCTRSIDLVLQYWFHLPKELILSEISTTPSSVTSVLDSVELSTPVLENPQTSTDTLPSDDPYVNKNKVIGRVIQGVVFVGFGIMVIIWVWIHFHPDMPQPTGTPNPTTAPVQSLMTPEIVLAVQSNNIYVFDPATSLDYLRFIYNTWVSSTKDTQIKSVVELFYNVIVSGPNATKWLENLAENPHLARQFQRWLENPRIITILMENSTSEQHLSSLRFALNNLYPKMKI